MRRKLEMAIDCIEKRRNDEALLHANMVLMEMIRYQQVGRFAAAASR